MRNRSETEFENPVAGLTGLQRDLLFGLVWFETVKDKKDTWIGTERIAQRPI